VLSAVAESGYVISMAMLLLCAWLTKFSLDLLIELGEKVRSEGCEPM
jgi:hypothetical protein